MVEASLLQFAEVRGKLIFVNFIPREEINERLSDERVNNEMLKLEMMFNEEPSMVGASARLQVIGK